MELNITPLSVANFFRVDRYTDLANGEIICNVPVLSDAVEDPMRKRVYQGSTNLNLSNGQTISVVFGIAANTLEEAVAGWIDALKVQLAEIESNATRQRILNGAGTRKPQ